MSWPIHSTPCSIPPDIPPEHAGFRRRNGVRSVSQWHLQEPRAHGPGRTPRTLRPRPQETRGQTGILSKGRRPRGGRDRTDSRGQGCREGAAQDPRHQAPLEGRRLEALREAPQQHLGDDVELLQGAGADDREDRRPQNPRPEEMRPDRGALQGAQQAPRGGDRRPDPRPQHRKNDRLGRVDGERVVHRRGVHRGAAAPRNHLEEGAASPSSAARTGAASGHGAGMRPSGRVRAP